MQQEQYQLEGGHSRSLHQDSDNGKLEHKTPSTCHQAAVSGQEHLGRDLSASLERSAAAVIFASPETTPLSSIRLEESLLCE